ncbi:polyribonucleotide nucleotidyltransferase [Candidatus Nomurabacteria bacterium]|nr:polyribonucleotide nucleotidyltransferase [Candidatus Nomurabacteria bacterium]
MKKQEFVTNVAGKEWKAMFTDIADQANGSVILSCDDTVVMATAVMSKDGRDNRGWFNLTVEYMEKYYATGEILGGPYSRREGRPTTQATLGSRIIDRTLRPLFPHYIQNAIQVIVSVLAVGDADPIVLGTNAASLALATSDIPWAGPVGCIRLGVLKDSESLEINPYAPIKKSGGTTETNFSFDLLVCGANSTLNMIEAATFEASEEELGAALEKAQTEISALEQWQKDIVAKIGVQKKAFEEPETPANVLELFDTHMRATMIEGLFGLDSKARISEFEEQWHELLAEKYPEDVSLGKEIFDAHSHARSRGMYHFHHTVDEMYHDAALQEGKRADLRAMNEVRDLYAQAGGFSQRLHGSGLFYRGGTHVFSALALAGPDTRLEHDEMEVKNAERFIHHYNFPPFSAGETGRVGGFNRRQIGHGALVQKAFYGVLPSVEEFPYTMRVVSESVASNGSTSQASICATTLALMDGGVPITRPVAGIAMGLMMNKAGDYKILTDIQGPEDHHGDMDFKVAGTRAGVTAIQLDIKVDGVPVKILKEALIDAKAARETILDTIESEIAQPRAEMSQYAPKIVSTKIDEDDIGKVIGSGGKTIQKIQEDTATTVTIEEDGTVFITGLADGPLRAKNMIEQIVKKWQVGEVTSGRVIKILDIGAIVQISPMHDGLVHVSEIAPFRVANVADVLKEGMDVPVKVVSVDAAKGRIGLSIEKAEPGFIKQS